MTAKPDSAADAAAARKRELSMIHIAVGQLGMGDDAYRDLLERVCGKRSAAELTALQRRQFLDHLKRCGWAPKPKANPARLPQPRKARAPADAHADRWEKARALWAELAKAGAVRDDSDKALLDWVRAQQRVAAWRWLNTHQVNNVIESLKAWCNRVGVELQ